MKRLLLVFLTVLIATPVLADYSGFRRSLNDKPHGYMIVRQPVRVGPIAERFEVRPGDCAAQPGWDDCAKDRERSELGELPPLTNVGEEAWYAFSFYLDPSYPNVFPTKTALGQLHQKGAPHPPLEFNHGLTRDTKEMGYYLDFNLTERGHFLLIPEAQMRGRWHDVIVHARWSKGMDGLVEVWVNGVLKARVPGPNTNVDGPIFFKYGVYRSFVSRYRNRYGVPPPPQVAYFDEVHKGRTRADVYPTLR